MALIPGSGEVDRAVFLDKDGTLVDNVPFNVEPERIRLAPGVAEGLPLLSAAGYRIVVVSNQPGVALGLFPEAALEGVRERLRTLLRDVGVNLDGFYYCPHYVMGSVAGYTRACECRKPAPGLIERAARELDVVPGRSWLVGDILDDVEAGRRAGCRTVLIDNGNETVWRSGRWRLPNWMAADFEAAARTIVAFDRAVDPEAA